MRVGDPTNMAVAKRYCTRGRNALAGGVSRRSGTRPGRTGGARVKTQAEAWSIPQRGGEVKRNARHGQARGSHAARTTAAANDMRVIGVYAARATRTGAAAHRWRTGRGDRACAAGMSPANSRCIDWTR